MHMAHWPWSRIILCGPVVFVVSVVVLAAMGVWYPAGRAGIDNLVVPLIIYPLIWAALFFYALLDRRLARAWLIVVLTAACNGVLLFLHLSH